MLVDANLLLYAVDEESPHHRASYEWLSSALNGERRVGLPWSTLSAFLRIVTHPRATASPLTPGEAWRFVEEWLDCEVAWIPQPGARHASVLGDLIQRYDLRANMISDAQFAALAHEHGLTVYSADTDFARFREVRWINPLG
jgi:toxin-antitoxin system PIN domain toxin